MNSDYWSKVAQAHDVKCPRCGSQASFTITGEKSYTTNYCCDELNSLVDSRMESLIRSAADEPRKVKIKLVPPDGEPEQP